MARIKEGDVFELETKKGFTYLHYITKDDSLGELIRVLDIVFLKPISDIQELLDIDEKYYVFFPLAVANRKKIIKKVGNINSEKYNKPSFMKEKHYIGKDFKGWDIVNTDTWQRQFVKKLNTKQKMLSPWGILNDTLLIERIENDWTLEKWS
jgi:hypothetical protein|tara:strand:+ start:427 stop:882 length:456 start_codon:yes stop_codon:yes gene_type:complete